MLALAACAQLPPVDVPPPGAQRSAVVVDIDGTLTPRVWSVRAVRPDAAHALGLFAAKGYRIVYVTARTPLFQAGLPGWLERNGFPAGPLHVAQSHAERSAVDQFKARLLRDYRARGWELAYAYGDSATDFRAYADAGIPADRVFALRRAGDAACQEGSYGACLGGWAEHTNYIEREVPDAR